MRMVKTLDDMTTEDKWKDAGCPKCGCLHFDTRDVNEVDGMAVGPAGSRLEPCGSCGPRGLWMTGDRWVRDRSMLVVIAC